jgi:hypothetical protein
MHTMTSLSNTLTWYRIQLIKNILEFTIPIMVEYTCFRKNNSVEIWLRLS